MFRSDFATIITAFIQYVFAYYQNRACSYINTISMVTFVRNLEGGKRLETELHIWAAFIESQNLGPQLPCLFHVVLFFFTLFWWSVNTGPEKLF